GGSSDPAAPARGLCADVVTRHCSHCGAHLLSLIDTSAASWKRCLTHVVGENIMACTEIRPADRGPPQPGPWLWVLTGLVTTTAAVPLALADHRLDEQSQSLHALLLGGRVVLLLVGVLATGVAVARQARSALVLGLAALVAFTASHALDAELDSVSVLFRIATMVALVAGIIVLLPQTGRRVLASLVLLFHFGGILTAVANVPPPGGDAPWLVSQLWSRVYRPYLQFMYLTNAYHFYAPA